MSVLIFCFSNTNFLVLNLRLHRRGCGLCCGVGGITFLLGARGALPVLRQNSCLLDLPQKTFHAFWREKGSVVHRIHNPNFSKPHNPHSHKKKEQSHQAHTTKKTKEIPALSSPVTEQCSQKNLAKQVFQADYLTLSHSPSASLFPFSSCLASSLFHLPHPPAANC